ncbi:FG-GAP-like repeat-containing protein [Candidatus Neomarinimicrobiota bacterium]
MNGNGNMDLVAANYFDNDISVLLNSGTGTFASRNDYSLGYSYPASIISADLDGDGDRDLATANLIADKVGVLLNDGDGIFAGLTSYTTADAPYSVTVADLDDDGAMDLVTANRGGDNVSVLLNNGNGTFAAKVDYVAGDWPNSVFAADLNGDGHMDLATANKNSNNISVLLNNGNGTFADSVNYAVGTWPYSVFSADLDGDGDMDIATATATAGSKVSVLLNNGDGTFGSKTDFATGSNAQSIFASDLNGDGNIDLATANQSGHSVSVLMNTEPIYQDSLALVALYNSTDGANWNNHTNWLTTEPLNNWYGVTVTDGRVTSLNLYNNQLTGAIPVEMGNLTNLETLNLNSNQLTDTIPAELGNLTAVVYLGLGSNQLNGPIPPELGNLTELTDLHLESNDLSSDVPSELGNLASLWYLYLNGNDLSDLPDLSGLYSLQQLYVANNRLTFEDLEPNLTVAGSVFSYSPQDSVGMTIDTVMYIEDALTMSVSVGGDNNEYQWVKDQVAIPIATSDSCTISSLQLTDTGSYICAVSNTLVTGLTIYSRPLHVTVMDTAAPAAPQELIAVAGNSQVSLTWRQNTEEDFLRYRIYGDVVPNPTTLIDSSSSITDTTRIYDGLTNNTTYYYRITAVDVSLNESDFSNEVSATPSAFEQIGDVIVIQPGPGDGKDAYVHSGNPTTNYGTDISMYFGGWPMSDTTNLYIQFDLTTLAPFTEITSARLDLYQMGQNGWMSYDYGAYKINEAWDESTITWNTQPASQANPMTTFFGGDWADDVMHRWRSIHGLEYLVQQWIDDPAGNYGLVIRAVNELYGAPRVGSSDQSELMVRPKLVINSPGTGFAGVVTDQQTEEPIEGVVLGAYRGDETVPYAEDTTDVAGAYVLSVTFPDTYDIRVKGKNGYLPYLAAEQVVGEGEYVAMDISLEPNAHAIAGTATEIWTLADSPYIIVGDIVVPAMGELVIEPGVEVRFHGHYPFIVEGTLRAEGTETDSILFTRDEATDESRGAGIRFNSSSTDTSILAYCIIEYGNADNGLWDSAYEDRGGGVYCNNTNLVIRNSHIRNNRATTGGGIYAYMYDGPSLLIRDNVIENNVSFAHGYYACGGGAIAIDWGTSNVVVANNLVIANTFTGENIGNSEGGGAFHLGWGNATVMNNTIYGNWSPKGSGIHSYGDFDGALLNNIVWNNDGSIHGDQIVIQVNEYEPAIPEDLAIHYNDIQDAAIVVTVREYLAEGLEYTAGIGNIDADPVFADSLQGDFHLQTESPAIDSGRFHQLINGILIQAPATDFDGNVRPNPVHSNSDMGAFENADGVTNPNGIPVAAADTVSVTEDEAMILDILANDLDPDYDPLMVQAIDTLLTVGSVEIDAGAMSVTYTPASNFYGADSFAYVIGDDFGGLDTGKVLVNVLPVNDPPIFIAVLPDTSFAEDDTLFIPFARWHNLVEDPEHPDTLLTWNIFGNDPISVIYRTLGFVLRPPMNWWGGDSISIVVSDGYLSDTTSWFLLVTPVNDPPVVVQATGIDIAEGDTVTITNEQLLVTDPDNSNAELTYSLQLQPSVLNGVFLVNGEVLLDTGTFTQADIDSARLRFAHNGSEAVLDSIGFDIADTSEAMTWIPYFEIRITPVNDPPFAFDLFDPPDSAYIMIDHTTVSEGLRFDWEPSGDVDSDTVWYTFALSGDLLSPIIPDTFVTVDSIVVPYQAIVMAATLLGDTVYAGTWTVLAFDESDTTWANNGPHFITIHVSASLLGLYAANLLPEEYALHQNYPNPFNPSTTIRYDLPEAADVRLVIYDMLGREVVRLVRGRREAGHHQIIWNGRMADGREVPSGVYIVRMATPTYTKSMKMVLLK